MPNESFVHRSKIPARAEEVYAWHARPAAFQRLQPPWEPIDVVSQVGDFGDRLRITFRARWLGPIKRTWVVELFDFEPGRGFKYRQLKGPFADWLHTHRFIPDGDGSILENEIAYRLPLGPLGAAFGAAHVEERLKAMFAYRHALTASDLRRHGQYRDRPRLKIAITGSRGLIGSELALFLATGGHDVLRLLTSPPHKPLLDGTQSILWKPQEPVDPAILDGLDAVIHLAADGISEGRWTDAKRKKILDSRTIPTRFLAEAIAALPSERRPKCLLSASAVGIYGDRGDEVLIEESPTGSGFLAEVCKQWEAAASQGRGARGEGRVVNLRIGAVLTPKGGALGKQLPPFRAGLGATLGSGKQWVPWVTVHDVVGAIHHCLQTESLSGPVNLIAPNSMTNRDFSKTIGRVLWRPVFLSLPRFALRAMFGDIADAVLLASMRGYPKKLLESGFVFDHPELEAGLLFLLGK